MTGMTLVEAYKHLDTCKKSKNPKTVQALAILMQLALAEIGNRVVEDS